MFENYEDVCFTCYLRITFKLKVYLHSISVNILKKLMFDTEMVSAIILKLYRQTRNA